MDIEAAVFDLDGTLLNTIEDIALAMNGILQEYNLPTHQIDEYRAFVGNGSMKLVQRSVPEEIRTDTELLKEMRGRFIEVYKKNSCECTSLFDGIYELVVDLKKSGLKLAVITNKVHEAAIETVEHYFGKNLFDLVYGHLSPIPVKPHIGLINKVIKELNVDRSKLVYIGDSSVDIRMANYARVRSIGVCWGYRDRSELEAHGANMIAETVEDLRGLMLG